MSHWKLFLYWKLCQKDFIFQGLLTKTFREIWGCGGWTRAESICLFYCECGGLAQSFECRLLQPQMRIHRRIGSSAEVLVRLLHQPYKGVRNSKVPGGLNTECNRAANLQEISSMAWVISSDDQGGIFSFSCSISLIVLTIQITRSFAFIFLLMITWRNNLFQHNAVPVLSFMQ